MSGGTLQVMTLACAVPGLGRREDLVRRGGTLARDGIALEAERLVEGRRSVVAVVVDTSMARAVLAALGLPPASFIRSATG
jgi:hypothetical protein